MNKKLINNLQENLESKINFTDYYEIYELCKKCIDNIYDTIESGINKADFLPIYNEMRDKLVFDIIPQLYTNQSDENMENLHLDFINEFTELIIDFGPGPKVWDLSRSKMQDHFLSLYTK